MDVTGVAQTLTTGSMLVAIPLAALAGVVSFLSPCVLPLVPGYLSYMTGVAGAQVGTRKPKRSRAVLGALAFMLGVSVVFVSFGALFGGAGQRLIEHQRMIQMIMGVIVIILGLGFLGAIPALQREFRMHRMPTGTLVGAFMLGLLFAIGWTPCIGPALAAVQSMALSEASAARGALLSFVYVLGLGVPFIILGLMLEKSVSAVGALRRHSKLIMRFGGIMLIAIGLMQVTGYWNELMITLRVWAPQWAVPI